MHRRPIAIVLSLFAFVVSPTCPAEGIDTEAVQRAYAANNTNDVPLVWWMNGGMPMFLLYADGSLMVADRQSKSGLTTARLSKDDLNAALKKVSAQDGFWLLSPRHELTTWTDQALNTVSVRIPGKTVVSVSVYGSLTSRSKNAGSPPEAFTRFLDTLAGVTPEKMQPWDPGYVEILWADYDYAPDRSLPWPKEWPGLDSPLARSMKGAVITKIMAFPSSHLVELDAFLAQRPTRAAILIAGKKMSASYRWPLRGEKSWSSWNQ